MDATKNRKIDWLDFVGTVIAATAGLGALPLFLYLTETPTLPFILEMAWVLFVGLFVPVLCSAGFFIGLAGFRRNHLAVRTLGVLLMVACFCVGLWGLSHVVADADPSDCPGGPRYC